MVQLIALFFEHELLEYSQHFFFQSKKEKLQKKVAFLGFVEVMPQAKWLKTTPKSLKRQRLAAEEIYQGTTFILALKSSKRV